MRDWKNLNVQEIETRLFPENNQLSRLSAQVGPRSYQEFVIDYWNQNERLPDDFAGTALSAGPNINVAWRHAAA
jgi:hypothetical protein